MLTEINETILKLKINLPPGFGSVNSFLIQGEKGYIIIDSGLYSKESMEAYKEILNEPIEKVVLTHTHQDHIGLAKWFQEKHDIPIIVSQAGLEEMKKFMEPNIIDRFINLLKRYGIKNIPNRNLGNREIYSFQPDESFQDGDTLKFGNDYYEAIQTPGHAPDQFCFYQKEKKIMIVGDHILQKISPVIGLWNGYEDNPLKDYLYSLDKIEEYSVDLALTGHGSEIRDFKGRISEIRKRHYSRLEQALEAVQNSAKTPYEVCEEIYGEKDPVNISEFMAILTRLIYLESIGEVERIESQGEVKFIKS